MFIELTAGTCSAKAGGPCTGMTVAECPNGYIGTDTDTGPPVDCAGTGVGVSQTSLAIIPNLVLHAADDSGDYNILSLIDG